MADVGRLARVSHQTVSRVINGSPHVRPDTRRRVLAAMQELGYFPNSAARALATGRSNTLGVVSFDTTLYGPASTLFGIERAAHEAGYFIIVASLTALDRASVLDAVERLAPALQPAARLEKVGRSGDVPNRLVAKLEKVPRGLRGAGELVDRDDRNRIIGTRLDRDERHIAGDVQ